VKRGWFSGLAVLRVGFDALGAEGLEAGVSVLFEEEFFGGAVGEGLGVELVPEGEVFVALGGVVVEEDFGGGVEAVADGVLCGLLFAGFRFGSGRMLCVF
jgi:hypothetical protein